jgi:hypothetical protein
MATIDGSNLNPSAQSSSGFVRASRIPKHDAMLADVRPVCVDGRRLPRERLKSMQPVRGELSVTRRRDPWRNEWVPIAVLRPEAAKDLPALDQGRISRWSGANLMLVGVEHVGRQKQSRPQSQRESAASLSLWTVALGGGSPVVRSTA